MKHKDKILPAVTAIMVVAVVICAIVIAAKGLGVVEGYDFGAGAYYYADIPGFEKIINDDAYKTSVPLWLHIILFLAWGWLMWRLWVWIDRRGK
ncbi:MAG: hypothetical protein J6J25_04960 [Bacteroidales bacterium]|nr:hypothetical protein [Bacteroidales bacterium]